MESRQSVHLPEEAEGLNRAEEVSIRYTFRTLLGLNRSVNDVIDD